MSEEPKTTLVDGSPVTEDHRDLDPVTGLQKDYVVLSEEERRKGFVRPVRNTYVHVGVRPTHPTRELTPAEHERYDRFGYVEFEAYPEGAPTLGRFWTKAKLSSGCGAATTMHRALAETYARDPKFYGSTYCCGCRAHFDVDEFVWSETDQRVGS